MYLRNEHLMMMSTGGYCSIVFMLYVRLQYIFSYWKLECHIMMSTMPWGGQMHVVLEFWCRSHCISCLYWVLNHPFCCIHYSSPKILSVGWTTPKKQNCPFFWGYQLPSNAWFLGPSSLMPQTDLDWFSRFCSLSVWAAHRQRASVICPLSLRVGGPVVICQFLVFVYFVCLL